MPIRLILDCDTGTDDAVAIMAAALHPDLELVAVTTVDGNVPLDNVVENSLRVLDLIGSTVPVFVGAARPLIRPTFPVPRETLNGDRPGFHPPLLDLPASTSRPASGTVAAYLSGYYADPEHADTVLVATGPLTNIAIALSADPELASRIPRLVIMGGARGWGNVTQSAEFNIWVDPEAAATVFNAGIADVLVVPLDATHSAPISLDDCDTLDAVGTPAALAASGFIRHRIESNQHTDGVSITDVAVHDALCIAALVHPEVLTDVRPFAVSIETGGHLTMGEMLMDDRPWSTARPNARVGLCADAQLFAQFLSHALGS